MIDLQKLRSVRKIIVHDHCPDGVASALILQEALPWASVQFVQYRTTEHKDLPAEPGLLFCDFSPPEERVQEFVAAQSIVLDHHKGVEPVVNCFGADGVFADEKLHPGVSGAVLAYLEVWKPLWDATKAGDPHPSWESEPESGAIPDMVHDFALLCGIRDTWQKQHPRWQEACWAAYGLLFPPMDRYLGTTVSPLLGADWRKYLWAGRIRYEKALQEATRAVQEGFRFSTASGTRALVFQGTRLSSDAAEHPDAQADLIVGFDVFIQEGAPVYLCSLRGRGYDCGAFARANGGNGHTAAAGFLYRNPTGTPYQFIQDRLAAYEQGA